MDTGVIVQYEECDNMGGLFEIHPIDGGYLIWGEGDVFRYDLSLNRVWRFQEEIFLFHYKVTNTFGLSMGKSTAGTFLAGITLLILTGS